MTLTMSMEAVRPWVSGQMDRLIEVYPSGYLEIAASVNVQIVYLIIGIAVEAGRRMFDTTYKCRSSYSMIGRSLYNHVVASLVHVAYVYMRGGEAVLTDTWRMPYEMPTGLDIVRQVITALLMREVFFYSVHRLFHEVPFLMKHIHSKHHEVLEPAQHHVWTISYMSVIDFLILYGAPVMLVAKALEMDIMALQLFALVSASHEQVNIVTGAEDHEDHHSGAAKGYGVYGIMDKLCGTA